MNQTGPEYNSWQVRSTISQGSNHIHTKHSVSSCVVVKRCFACHCSGFTLIELMIVVAIIAILAVIAYPSYQEYVKRSHRTDMQSEMMQQAQQLQSYYVMKHNYTSATLNNATNDRYTLALTTLTSQTWTMTATPTGAQDGDGVLMLDSRGQKCWVKGASSCTLSATSNWDGR